MPICFVIQPFDRGKFVAAHSAADLDIDEPDYLDRAVKVFHRPEDKNNSLNIAPYLEGWVFAWLVLEKRGRRAGASANAC